MADSFAPVVWLLCLVLSLASCQGEAGSAAPTDEQTTDTPIDTLALRDRLFADLSADTARAGREHNAIINYAIDHTLDVQLAPEGYYYQILEAGEGAPLAWGDRVRVHYRGRYLDGQEFDSSYRRQRPMDLYIGNVIAAWNNGLQRLRPGGRMLLIAPSAQAYGPEGLVLPAGDTVVRPHAILIFEVEVVERIAD